MSDIKVSINDMGVACLVLNRPEALNALNIPLMEDILITLQDMTSNPKVKALLVSGAGHGFCAGADIRLFEGENSSGDSPGAVVSSLMKQYFNPMMKAFYHFPKPVVIAVNGIAAGGGVGLALCGDVVVASRSAKLKVVQVSQLDIVADMGANWMLSRMAGRNRALAASLLGEVICGPKMEQWGLAWECVDDDALLPRAQELAQRLACLSVEAVLGTRQLIDLSTQKTYGQMLQQELDCQRDLGEGAGFAAKVSEFLR